jgi:hypothetical protein
MARTRDTANLTSDTNLFSDIANDRIGVGNVSPTSKLDVSGEITLSTSPFVRNTPTITSNYTVTTTYNAMSVGPITIASGITVTVNSGATWSIV